MNANRPGSSMMSMTNMAAFGVAMARSAAGQASSVPPFVLKNVPTKIAGGELGGLAGAGATLVQGYTEFLYAGPLWARRINRELAALLRAVPVLAQPAAQMGGPAAPSCAEAAAIAASARALRVSSPSRSARHARIASIAASLTRSGPSVSGKPCPRLTAPC